MGVLAKYVNLFHNAGYRAPVEMLGGEIPSTKTTECRSVRRSMRWWRTPVVDPGQSAGPKIPGEQWDRSFLTKGGSASKRGPRGMAGR
jgi:hypothetical protein